jgi:site-specific DNA-methyltransferase (cytosine-N4-specific)
MDAIFVRADSARLPIPDDSIDLVFCSPPYECQREYAELEFSHTGDDWLAWALTIFRECLRVSRGLVAWVIEGRTEDYSYSATPFLLMAELKKSGAFLRKPAVYQRNGIPGTGGPDWLRNDWEPIICATKNRGRLPWSDNTAMGSEPVIKGRRFATNRNADGTRKYAEYTDPDVTNPGNVIKCTVGSGNLGWDGAHENEAPFPQSLAEFFVRSFCPPSGIVLDPFSGSGTTAAAAASWGRRAIGIDLRQSQCRLGKQRLTGLTFDELSAGQLPLFKG